MDWFINFETWLYYKFGYTSVIHFEDVMTFSGGIFIGMLIMIALSGRVIFKLQKIKGLGHKDAKLIKIMHEGGKADLVADPKNVGESIETLLLVILRPVCTIKEYTFRDERRTKIVLLTLLLLGLLVLFLAICSITTIFTPPQ